MFGGDLWHPRTIPPRATYVRDTLRSRVSQESALAIIDTHDPLQCPRTASIIDMPQNAPASEISIARSNAQAQRPA